MIHRVQAFVVLLAVCAATAAVFTSSAGASTPADKKIAALQKQVTALSKTVTGLNKQVTTLKKQQVSLGSGLDAIAFLNACSIAVTSDALTSTWNIVDQMSAALQAGKTYFGTQPLLNDADACKGFQITRTQAVPPTLAAFQALLQLFASPSRALLAFAPYGS